MIRVFQFGLRPPIEDQSLIRAQLRAAHDYRNELVAIERGRRAAIRALMDTEEVQAAKANLKTATKSTRKDARHTLRIAHRHARESVVDELALIAERDASIRRDARALTTAYWGSYLSIEASADQVRKMPLYDRDGEPNDPRFQRWTGTGQIGVQLQGGLSTPKLLECSDTRLRIEQHSACGRYGFLSMRVGSNGRAPIWGRWPIKLHRALPDNGTLKWARVSCRRDGPHERWTCELTLVIPGEHPRTLDRELSGAIAVELEWSSEGDELRVARWIDDRGERGEVCLPAPLVARLRKASGIRSVRDQLLNHLRPQLARALHDAKPRAVWLLKEAMTIELWKSPSRFVRLAQRWREERCDEAREAYDLLQAWELRDAHLAEYEAGARRGSLFARREVYRLLAVRWSRRYRTIVLADQDLSREARWGDDADLRQVVGPSELRNALRAAFGNEEMIVPLPSTDPEEPIDMREHLIEQWRSEQTTESSRERDKTVETQEKIGNAWATRKAKKMNKVVEKEAARKPTDNVIE